MVHYEWTTLSGATRTGKYQHGKKHLPAVGTLIPIVYDRDNSPATANTRCRLSPFGRDLQVLFHHFSFFIIRFLSPPLLSHRTSRTIVDTDGVPASGCQRNEVS